MISIWEAETFFAPQDVLIVGGGFTGVWSALLLKKRYPKARITVIDRGLIPTGASMRNAGFACFGSLSELAADADLMGLEKTLALAEMRYRGLAHIEEAFDASAIEFVRCGGYELFNGSMQSNNGLDEKVDKFNHHLRAVTGQKHTYKRVDKKIARFGFGNTTCLIKNKCEGALHSGKLMQALLQKAAQHGVQFLSGEIIHFESGANNIAVQLATNQTLHAQNLLVCTNAFAKALLPEVDVVPARGQVLVTSPLATLPFTGTFHYDEGYYYFRNVGDRVLLGGARNADFKGEETTTMAISETIQHKLEQFLRNVILPYCTEPYTIDYRWAGIMGMGAEKGPIVKEVQPRVFCAVRMSGMGVALAPVVAEVISKQITID